MSKSEIVLSKILEWVSIEAEIPTGKILSKCSEIEVVDARWICVKILHEYGYYPSKIGELLNITPRYSQYIITDFDDRILTNKLMRINYETVLKKFRTYYDIDA